MAQLGRYVFSVALSALVPGILISLLDPKGATTRLIRFSGGIFLLFVLIQPISRLDLTGLLDSVAVFSPELEFDTREGSDLARESMAQIIIRETEAYILDKAQALGLDATVTVSLSRDTIPVPEAVEVIWSGPGGNITELSGIIHKDLGIPKENQTWKRKN